MSAPQPRQDTPELRKARGAFFTPEDVARYVTDWAIRTPSDVALEPSCGEAAFLLQAGRRLAALRGGRVPDGQLRGAELHEQSATVARELLSEAGYPAEITVGDFFREVPSPDFDAVVGNPPYVRYQEFSGESRDASLRAAHRAGVKLSNLASSWAAFTIHSALFLKRGGRLGLVLPAELLTVNYAAGVRDFLLTEFSNVRLVLFNERIFPGVLEEVVLLLADGRGNGPAPHCEVLQTRNGETLPLLTESDVTRWTPIGSDRWSELLLDASAIDAYRSVVASEDFVPLDRWGETTLGMVTGANHFFTMTDDQRRRHNIAENEVIQISPPGSGHLRNISLTSTMMQGLQRDGLRTWLLRPAERLSSGAKKYIEEGEELGVHKGYKCRIRKPWWKVPYLKPADLLLTYMNADTARLCHNAARTHHLNSVHGVYLHSKLSSFGSLLALASLNSVSLIGAEVVGRPYGGGLLKLEPKEADRWPMPSCELLKRSAEDLRAIRSEVRKSLAKGQLLEATEAVDTVLLEHARFTSLSQLEALRLARKFLHDRRVSRGRTPRDVRSPDR